MKSKGLDSECPVYVNLTENILEFNIITWYGILTTPNKLTSFVKQPGTLKAANKDDCVTLLYTAKHCLLYTTQNNPSVLNLRKGLLSNPIEHLL